MGDGRGKVREDDGEEHEINRKIRKEEKKSR